MKRALGIVAPLGAVALLALAHEALASWLDQLDLAERLLSPSGDALVALPLAALLYVVRFALVFGGAPLALIGLAAIVSAVRARRLAREGMAGAP